ncbi:hypothetical protein [Nocardia sp. NBC_00511]|uniref:hypothetical protein n=1 Tax=Nocardia sp. NBC_00511 TaxID=2903591 RepID=UPI0030E155C9
MSDRNILAEERLSNALEMHQAVIEEMHRLLEVLKVYQPDIEILSHDQAMERARNATKAWRPAALVIETVEELATVPDGAILRDNLDMPQRLTIDADGRPCVDMIGFGGLQDFDPQYLPVTVLWQPEVNG